MDEEHYPNPFDFVPFADQPMLKTEAEFNSMGDLFSGYLEVELKALTPIHVVGYQEPDGNGRKSYICRQNELACIPAASIRGCLRAFIEALTAGWVSQATPVYEKEYKKRHIGFATFERHESRSRRNKYQTDAAVKPAYKPKAFTEEASALDVASYLFGIVVEKEKGTETKHDALARKSRVWIEDAAIQPGQLDDSRYWLPDITGEAFMGGAKPSASNWWYMQPREVWQRRVKIRDREMSVAEFIGERYWGRKFYFHQKPERCIGYYDQNQKDQEPGIPKWIYRDKNSFCKVQLECLIPDTSTDYFRIYVNRVPRQLLILLVLSLLPGNNIRHKLGYGKAYGYGSVEFSIMAAHLRVEDANLRIPAPLKDMLAEVLTWSEIAWEEKRMSAAEFDPNLIDWHALEKLAQVLGWENVDSLTFTYPPFTPGYFARGISDRDFNRALSPKYQLGKSNLPSDEEARFIASQLFNVKAPIHFRLYQEKAYNWELISKRKP